MKNIFLLFFFLMLIKQNVINAQYIDDCGFKAGFSSSSIRSKNLSNSLQFYDGNGNIVLQREEVSNQLIAPYFSFFFRHILNDYFVLDHEVTFMQKGGRYVHALGIGISSSLDGPWEMISRSEYSSSVTYNYILLSLNGQFGYRVSCLKPYLIIGPNLNYMFKGEVIEGREIKRLLVGYNLGFGINIDGLTGNGFFIECTYNGDYTAFEKNELSENWNRTWKIGLGIKL